MPGLRSVMSKAVTGVDSELHHELVRPALRDPSSKAPSRHQQGLVFKHLDALWVCVGSKGLSNEHRCKAWPALWLINT